MGVGTPYPNLNPSDIDFRVPQDQASPQETRPPHITQPPSHHTHPRPPSKSPTIPLHTTHPPSSSNTLIQHLNHPIAASIMTSSHPANHITSPAHPEAPQNQSNKSPSTSEPLDPTLAPQDQAPASEPHEALATSEAALAPGPLATSEAALSPGNQEVQDPPPPPRGPNPGGPAPKDAQIMRDGFQAATVDTMDDSHSPSPKDTQIMCDGVQATTVDTVDDSHSPSPKDTQIMRDGFQAATVDTVDDSHSPSVGRYAFGPKSVA
ncbi:hypothetical protein PGT21_015859 [Puccinia graminis f. sp. tritici]|uniref:Uncharacterized protein n=1 Tax=Puccinia graminis f. sp. tritici TaxID=56615 RepID=A0A5B0PSJ8_PUCGR|nr:hypothetical protein PGT21_015859 [Puccinia graminis f. sp. tritici]